MKTKFFTPLRAPGRQPRLTGGRGSCLVRWPLGLALAFLLALPAAKAATRTVQNLNDSGSGSLRETLSVSAPSDTIVFATGLSGTLALTSGELGIGRSANIVGPGASILGISSSASRIFHIDPTNAVVSISGLTLSGGRAYGAYGAVGMPGQPGQGGAIFNSGTLAMTNCILVNNEARGGDGGNGGFDNVPGKGGAGEGGGIFSQGRLVLVNCAFLNNRSMGGRGPDFTYDAGSGGASAGGGIQCSGYGSSILALNCTIALNQAVGGIAGRSVDGSGRIMMGGAGVGGGLSVVSGTATLRSCTISSNSSTGGTSLSARAGGTGMGGGIAGDGASINLENTIVAGNTVAGGAGTPTGAASAPDVNGPVSSQGHNLIGRTDGSGGWIASDLTGTIVGPLNPLLGPLQANRGSKTTFTMLPQPGSAAIDAGDDSIANTLAADQRGFPRKCGAHVDIGAAELYAPPTLTIGRTPAGVTVSWLSPFIGFQLQENLGVSRTNWVAASQPVSDNGTVKSIVVSPSSGQRLYRLVSPVNSAILLDGQQSRVTIAHAGALNAFPFAVTCWIRTSQSSPQAKGLVSKYADASGYGYSLILVNGRARAWYFKDPFEYVWDGGLGLDGGFVADGNWHHLAFVVSGSGGTLYVDGVAAANLPWTGTAGPAASPSPLLFGSFDGQSSLEGLMAEVTLWNRTLSQSEVTALKNSKLTGAESGLVGYWTFIEGVGTIANDQTGHGYYGTLQNGATWMPSDPPLNP